MWWFPVPLSLQTFIILLQQFLKKLCYDKGDKIPVQKGREEACEAVWGSSSCCFDLEAGGLQPVYNFLIMTSAGVLWRIQINFWQKTTKSYIISEKGKEKLRDVPYLKVVCLLTLSWLCLDSKLFLTCRFSSTCWSSFTLFCLHLIGLFSLLFWSFLLTLWFDLFFDWPDVARRGRTCLSRGDFGGTRWGSYLLGCARQKRQRLWRMPV